MNLRLTDPVLLAACLYDPRSTGVMIDATAIGPQDRTAMLCELEDAPLQPARRELNGVEQRFDRWYTDGFDPRSRPVCHALQQEYASWYRRLGSQAGFSGTPNSFGVHRYPVGCKGIGMHRDFASSVNLVSIAVLAGSAPFHVERSAYRPEPGDIIHMRGPRSAEEYDLRPRHGVGIVTEQRTVVCIRQELQTP